MRTFVRTNQNPGLHPKILARYGLLAWTRVSANSEKCVGSQWAVRVGQRLQSRFGKSGVARKLGLVQIVVEASAIRGGFPNTQPSESVSGLRCRSVLMGLWGGAVHPTAWMKIYANFRI
jgi:hypothetical protein